MAYTTTPWNNSNPTGAEGASTIDDIIRALKLDIQERLSSFFSNIDTDPLQIKSGASTAGAFTVGGALTVTTGGVTITAGGIIVIAGDLYVSAGRIQAIQPSNSLSGLYSNPTDAGYVGWSITSSSTRAASPLFWHFVAQSNAVTVASINGDGAYDSKGGFRALGLAAASTTAFASSVTVDTFSRFGVTASGIISWGSGSGAADTNLYRDSADVLKTDDSFICLGLTVTGLGAGGGVVSVGAPDSGGAGYRLLRVPN